MENGIRRRKRVVRKKDMEEDDNKDVCPKYTGKTDSDTRKGTKLMNRAETFPRETADQLPRMHEPAGNY